ncbi:hypothetical protein DL96DRAFT_1684915 [Flagelloscypha sp. PMI_526]|nr:hypothetical protein DL96DRAFT_1684915 [Flagelloscypha sp. PMI_526]
MSSTGSYDSDNEHIRRSHYGNFLKQDIENSVNLPFDEFLSALFGCNDDGMGSSRFGLWNNVATSTIVLEKLKEIRNKSDEEKSRSAPFIAFANTILDGLGHANIRFCHNDTKHSSSSFATRMPDVVGVYVGRLNEIKSVESCNQNWIGSAALGVFAVPDILFGVYTTNAEIHPIYFDRSTIFVCHRVDIYNGTHDIVRLFDAIATSNWGLSALVSSPPSSPPHMLKNERIHLSNIFSGSSLSLGGYSFTCKDLIYLQHGVLGRGTRVFKVKVIRVPDQGTAKVSDKYCAKISWPSKYCSSEIVLVKTAREVANSREEWKDFLNNLPEILVHEDFAVSDIQIRLAAFSPSYEERIPRIIIMTVLFPIQDLGDAHQLMKVFRDVFFCHRWLYDSVNILHRDLSERNIMFRRIGDCVYGVLNDFDHSIDRSTEGPAKSSQRTGTPPFMAMDLLERDSTSRHLYRHDLESLYYTIVCNVNDLKETYDDETLGGYITFEKTAAIFDSVGVPKNGVRG